MKKVKSNYVNVIRWKLGFGQKEVPAVPAEELVTFKTAIVKPDSKRISKPNPRKIQITWIGHSTFLIQVGGVNILTDPIFSTYASPVPIANFRRLVPPGIEFDKLPEIHAVLISHDHYDHLDAPTIKKLGNNVCYFVPPGLKKWFNKRKITNVLEVPWWQSVMFKGLTVHSVPLKHFSGRGLLDMNKALWSGWILESKSGKIFFAGDTGYSPVFKKIGERFGPLKVSLIPIGAYAPRWFMRPVHVNPPEAVKMHRDIDSEKSIGMHWGTFKLADNHPNEPPVFLKKTLKEKGIDEESFIVMKFGETQSF